MSARAAVAENILQLCYSRLNDSYGASMDKRTDKNGKSYYSISFCKARTVDGLVRVYSPSFILVKWQTAFRDMPHTGSQVFRSFVDAEEFIRESFIRG